MAKQLDVKTARELYDGLARLLFAIDAKRFWRVWRAYQAEQQRATKPRTKQESRSEALLRRCG